MTKKYTKLLQSLRNAPQAQEQLKDMRLIFKDLINPPTVRTASALAKTSMTKERSDIQALINKGKDILTSGKYDEAAVKLITDPKWAKELKRINELSNMEKKITSTINILGKASGAYAGKKEK